MKKRLRKKLHLKDYAEYGVDMELKILSNMGHEQFDRFIEGGFIEEFVEGNGLYCGGGWDPETKSASLFIETGRDLARAENIAKKIKVWIEEKNIRYELKTAIHDAFYPDRILK